ncbi:30S ribosomal protein S9 [Lignipirellula cremea]|uniref:Small ribosomal subunit protein uS9 n=1 Tax=Lignipirellula cremea TaxID=2528010 RepID=A0A518DPQ3_9BACT|nr:30S ribosomal protein S9 [Lignipirellula cremea]QDU93809.1 30S ribosomal protein S9 [Lignipirellula cremea]
MVAVKKDKINGDALGTGRRKSSVARVRVRAGSGKITINQRPFEEYFPNIRDRHDVLAALEETSRVGQVDVIVRVNGGGSTGQSGAIKMGLSRALVSYDMDLFPALRDGGYLTRDARMKERKKPGLHGARRGTQFSKR